MMKLGLLLILLTVYAASPSHGAVPQPPRSASKGVDCNGVVAFSAVTSGGGKTRNKPISFNTPLLAKPSGYSTESGIFTVPCSGLYQFNFSGAGDNLKLSLRRRPSSATSSWNTIVETGLKGGSQTILLMSEAGEEIAVYLDAGSPSSTLNLSFSGFKITSKL